ncbi:hypothetical protein EXIGLDRAFT_24377 [Exidia glandulosa HHB12029]|uniref:Uncharacterized protein n=1 Tax=Exidia glandulosa HHB12029 TaxID=1314781 RepID=A0A165R226_EXIGL|nr:hypothetical protein EXIGLDRAFT_24377 [Exidia glandulosa HHB12029]
MSVRRSRRRQMDREIAEAAAIQNGFGSGGFEDDNDRLPLGANGLYARPSQSTARGPSTDYGSTAPGGGGYAPSGYSGYSGGYQVQYGQYNASPYAYQNGAQYGVPPPMPGAVEPDVYAYNPGAQQQQPHPVSPRRSGSSGDAMAAVGMAGVGARTRTNSGGNGNVQYPQMQGSPPPGAPHAAAMVPGMSRYAQARAQPEMRQVTPPPVAATNPPPSAFVPPAPPAPMRQSSASSVQVQDNKDYGSGMDYKVRASSVPFDHPSAKWLIVSCLRRSLMNEAPRTRDIVLDDRREHCSSSCFYTFFRPQGHVGTPR